MTEVVIRLEGETRDDGSVFINCPELPLFNVVGRTEQEALSNALSVLPEFLARNFYDVGQVRQAMTLPRLKESSNRPLLPAHVIASVGGGKYGTQGSANDR